MNPSMVSTAPANLSLMPNPFPSPKAGNNMITMQDQSTSRRGDRADENVFAASAQPYQLTGSIGGNKRYSNYQGDQAELNSVAQRSEISERKQMRDVACESANFDPIQPSYNEFLNSFDQRQPYNMTSLGTDDLLWNQMSLHSEQVSRLGEGNLITNALPYSSLRKVNHMRYIST